MKKLIIFIILLCSGVQLSAQTKDITSEESIVKMLDSSAYYYNTGEYSKSLKTNINAVRFAEKIKDTSLLQEGYSALGYDYLILDDTIHAKKSFKKARFYAVLSNNKRTIGNSYLNLATVFGISPKNLDKSISYYEKAISIYKEQNDVHNLGTAYYNVVYTLMDHKKYERSLPYLRELDKIKHELNAIIRGAVQNLWATYYLEVKKYKKADQYLSEILRDTLLQTSSVDLAEAYQQYSTSLYGQKRYKEAYDYRLKFQELNKKNLEKLHNEESKKVDASFRLAQYKKDIEQTELKNKLQAEVVASKSRQNIFLIGIVLASLLLLIVFYISIYTRKKLIQRLKKKNTEYLRAKHESEKLSKSKASFFSTVSHELRTPLYGVIGLSTILMDDPKLKSHEQDIKSLKFSADYLLALINDVLQINKIESQAAEENKERFQIRDFIRNITSSFEYMRIQNNNTITITIADSIPNTIEGDATRLSQILMNLIGNACKFTENGTIDIILQDLETVNDTALIKFSIIDTGMGIPKEKHASIFDEFSQLKSKHYTYQGTGLGLPIVKKLLNSLGSDIHLESQEGKGANFNFAITFDIASEPATVQPTIIVDEHILKGKHILIVDDNRINQIVTSKILQKSEVIFDLADNGKEAVDKAKDNTYDLILMDINMPVMDGMEATQAIRDFDQDIPIIALTAVEVKEMRYKISESGMNDIIVKPYDITIFKRTIVRNLSISIQERELPTGLSTSA